MSYKEILQMIKFSVFYTLVLFGMLHLFRYLGLI